MKLSELISPQEYTESTARGLTPSPPVKNPAAYVQRQQQISIIKRAFTQFLAEELQLIEVEAPILTDPRAGEQDTLSGSEKAVKVSVAALDADFEVVHSLAKWKRQVLATYGFSASEATVQATTPTSVQSAVQAAAQPPTPKGILTHMKALRPDEECLSPIHSVYVDQWDWEQVIAPSQRTYAQLKASASAVYSTLKRTLAHLQAHSQAPIQANSQTYSAAHLQAHSQQHLQASYPNNLQLPESLTFISAEALLQRYPHLNAKARERAITQAHKAVFITGIGAPLSNGKSHDTRAPDYDDWSTFDEHGQQGLNGDLLVWSDALDDVMELSSMGIRVDPAALRTQLELTGRQQSAQLPWHQALLQGKLPASVGGGIGQSRVCMFLLQLTHIGYVQAGVWSEQTRAAYPGLL